jgi:hypothetical protein
MPADSKPPLLTDYDTEEETAANIGVCVRTLRNWRRDKAGPPITMIGRQLRYYRPSVVAWIRAQERAPDSKAA